MARVGARVLPTRVLPALLVLAASAAAQDWPQWRGPNRDGIAPGFVAPASWPHTLRKGWQIPAGAGHSSPVVAGERVFVFFREGEEEVVAAFDLASGRPVWRQSYPAPYSMNPAAFSHGKGPKSTPLVHEARLYTLGIGGVLSCFESGSGRLVWRKEFSKEFRETSPLYGAALSPAIEGDLLFAHVGGPGDGAFTAFGAKTGAVRWAAKGDGPAYASPVVATLAGTRQVVTQTQNHVAGFAAETGQRLWALPLTTDYDQNTVTPVVDGDRVIYSGLDKGVHAVRIVRRGPAFSVEPSWDNPEVSLYLSSPVLAGGRLCGLSHRKKGQFFCLDAATGRTLWLSDGRQGDNAALVAAGDHLLFLTTEARLVVARRDTPAFAPVATYTVADSPTWAHPALAGRALIVRDALRLALWRLE